MNGATQSVLRQVTRVTRPLALRSARKTGSGLTIVRHIGRRSGRVFETPVVAVEHDKWLFIALPYGERTDWLRNVLAAGGATLVTGGQACEVNDPQVVPMSEAIDYFGPKEQRLQRRFGVTSALRVHRV